MYIENINLGTIQSNKKHNFVALIRNDKEFPITITKLKVGCSSCTEAKVRKNIIEVKEDVLMDVMYKPFSIGTHEKTITIFYTENNVQLQYVFIFNAKVV